MDGLKGNPLRGLRVLDGGLATELEFRGADLSGPLWSAHVLDEAPEAIGAVHQDYLRAGADCIESASYQISALGYAELGREDWARALRQSGRKWLVLSLGRRRLKTPASVWKRRRNRWMSNGRI